MVTEKFVSLLNDIEYRAGPPSSLYIYAPVLRQCVRVVEWPKSAGTEFQDHNAEWILIPIQAIPATASIARECCPDHACRHFILATKRKWYVGLVEFDCTEDVKVERRELSEPFICVVLGYKRKCYSRRTSYSMLLAREIIDDSNETKLQRVGRGAVNWDERKKTGIEIEKYARKEHVILV